MTGSAGNHGDAHKDSEAQKPSERSEQHLKENTGRILEKGVDQSSQKNFNEQTKQERSPERRRSLKTAGRGTFGECNIADVKICGKDKACTVHMKNGLPEKIETGQQTWVRDAKNSQIWHLKEGNREFDLKADLRLKGDDLIATVKYANGREIVLKNGEAIQVSNANGEKWTADPAKHGKWDLVNSEKEGKRSLNDVRIDLASGEARLPQTAGNTSADKARQAAKDQVKDIARSSMDIPAHPGRTAGVQNLKDVGDMARGFADGFAEATGEAIKGTADYLSKHNLVNDLAKGTSDSLGTAYNYYADHLKAADGKGIANDAQQAGGQAWEGLKKWSNDYSKANHYERGKQAGKLGLLFTSGGIGEAEVAGAAIANTSKQIGRVLSASAKVEEAAGGMASTGRVFKVVEKAAGNAGHSANEMKQVTAASKMHGTPERLPGELEQGKPEGIIKRSSHNPLEEQKRSPEPVKAAKHANESEHANTRAPESSKAPESGKASESSKAPEAEKPQEQPRESELDKDKTPPPERLAAEKILAGARAVEEQVTKELCEQASGSGGQMEGLQYRLKSQESLERKLRDGEIPDNINDALRYTTTFSPDKLAAGANHIMGELENKGYEKLVVKNTFEEGKVYIGINTTFVKDGQKFELQFHTPESLNVKEVQNHKLYEVFRELYVKDAQTGLEILKPLSETAAVAEKYAEYLQENYPHLAEMGRILQSAVQSGGADADEFGLALTKQMRTNSSRIEIPSDIRDVKKFSRA